LTSPSKGLFFEKKIMKKVTQILYLAFLFISANAFCQESSITYTIIQKETLHNIKCSIDIRLSDKISEGELKRLALKIKADLGQEFERIFIVYYLPNMEVGAGGWATTHFNPTLEVSINGLTKAEETKLIQGSDGVDGRDIIGIWLNESPFMGSLMTLYRKNGAVYLENKFKDGSESVDEMKVEKVGNESRYTVKGDNPFGEYYRMNAKGDIEMCDKEGILFTAKKK
jgi:hypothetical protein